MKLATVFLSALALVAAADEPAKLRVSVTKKVTCDRKSRNGDDIAIHYVGRLENGKEFDNSLERGEPIDFPLGAGMVIEGWEKGTRGMCLGEERRLTVPPHMAYGNMEVGGIPPGSTLVFDTVLVGINDDTIEYDVEAARIAAAKKTEKLTKKANAKAESKEAEQKREL